MAIGKLKFFPEHFAASARAGAGWPQNGTNLRGGIQCGLPREQDPGLAFLLKGLIENA
ncbi:hypothetical protein JCM17843_25470 [Kordiimonadales bacterium JCM 17843]|nr:hypothetical protein JCM17843_25470 [Kordiimonadales bacterium JCM 17843]